MGSYVGKRFLNRLVSERITSTRLPGSAAIIRLKVTSDRQASGRHTIVAIRIANEPAHMPSGSRQPGRRLTLTLMLVGIRGSTPVLRKSNGRGSHHQNAQQHLSPEKESLARHGHQPSTVGVTQKRFMCFVSRTLPVEGGHSTTYNLALREPSQYALLDALAGHFLHGCGPLVTHWRHFPCRFATH